MRESHGRLEDTPFGVLFRSLTAGARTAVLEIERAQVRKRLEFVRGVPVECSSNLVHETLVHTLVEQRRLSADRARGIVSSAAARGVRVGEILIEEGVLDEDGLHRALRRSLVRKILECFTWTHGRYRVLPFIPEATPPPDLDVPGVTFSGLTRYAPDAHVRAEIAGLIGKTLAFRPNALALLKTLPLSRPQLRTLVRIRERLSTEELLLESPVSRDETLRLLYALRVMGALGVEGEQEAAAEAPAVAATGETDAPPPAQRAVGRDPGEPAGGEEPAGDGEHGLCTAILQEYIDSQRKDAFALLGVGPDADEAEIRKRYLELSARYAPGRFEAPELQPAADAADALLAAVVDAWATLKEPRRRAELAAARRSAGEEARPEARAAFLEDTRELASEYAAQGQERLAEGNYGAARGLFDLAQRSDPRERAHAVDAAYAQARQHPEQTAASLAALEQLLEREPDDAYACFRAAELSHAAGRPDAARQLFRRGCQAWLRAAPASE